LAKENGIRTVTINKIRASVKHKPKVGGVVCWGYESGQILKGGVKYTLTGQFRGVNGGGGGPHGKRYGCCRGGDRTLWKKRRGKE